MTLKIIAGDTSCGKSELICRQLVAQSEAFPEKRFIAIVPEQATLLMQKALIAIHPRQIITNIDIVSFGFLAQLVFKELGKATADILDDTGKALILRKVLADIKDDLSVYSGRTGLPGFTEEVKSMITELKQYGIDDNELFLMQEAAEEKNERLLFSKIGDLRLIFRKFNEEIEEKYTTAEEILDIFSGCVSSSEIIRDAEIFLDGFTGFTPVQYKLIGEMLKYAADITVSVTIPENRINENCPEYDLFYLSNKTYFRLLETAASQGIKTETEFCCKDEKREALKTRSTKIYAAKTPESEVTFTAAKIMKLIKEDGYRFRDIAVIVSDTEAYNRNIRQIFDEAGISFFIDNKTRLSQNMLAHFVLSALRLSEERFSYDSVFAYLKSGLSGLSPDEVSKLENYCLEFGIKGIKAFRKEFEKNSGKKPKWDLEEINGIRQRFVEETGRFYEMVSKKTNTAAEYYDALMYLLEKNGIEEKISQLAAKFSEEDALALGKEYEQIYEEIKGLLEKIRLLLGGERLSIREYSEILSQGLDEIKVGVIPASLDSVLVGDLIRTRLSSIKYLFFLGFNEGRVPMEGSGGSIIFTQKEREFLKTREFDLAPTVLENICTQRFYIYLLLAKPENGIWLTYAAMNPDGTGMQPSSLLSELDELLPGVVIETESDPGETSWRSGKLYQLAMTIRKPDEALLKLFSKEAPERLHQIIEGAFFTNRQTPLDNFISEQLYGSVLKGSVSRYEQFAACPFKHFMRYGLRIEKRPEYEIKAADIGNVYHESLERYSKKLKENGYTFRNISDAESHRIIKECVEEVSASMGHDILESSARNEYLKERILKVSQKTTDVLRSQVAFGLYEPELFELEFSTKLEDNAKFNGKIDRVDIYEGQDVLVKIIDYKSGNKSFDVIDIYSGLQLQLVAYLKEALKTVREKYPQKNVEPGGVYYYLINDSFVRDEAKLETKNMMSGLTNCSEEALKAIDTTVGPDNPANSTIVNIKYGKDGLKSASAVANSTEFSNMLDFVENKLTDISSSIKEGNVDIHPSYKSNSDNACRYCDYKNICRFEDGKHGTEWNRIPEETDRSEAEEKIFRRIQNSDS